MGNKIHMRDIPIIEVLEYQKKYSDFINNMKDFSKTMPFTYEALPYPPKVIYRVMEKLADEDYLDYGVSLRTAWLTPKGEEYIKTHRKEEVK